jgi:hypothetical protein
MQAKLTVLGARFDQLRSRPLGILARCISAAEQDIMILLSNMNFMTSIMSGDVQLECRLYAVNCPKKLIWLHHAKSKACWRRHNSGCEDARALNFYVSDSS